jgi:hypothetical protein
MNKNPSKNKITNWIKSHVRPHLKWKKLPDNIENTMNNVYENSVEGWREQAEDRVEVGIKFKWRF